jgi:hypothetical protein
MVARTRHYFKLYVHCLPCFEYVHSQGIHIYFETEGVFSDPARQVRHLWSLSERSKVKLQLSLSTSWRHIDGIWGIAPGIFSFDTRCSWVVITPLRLYLPRRNPSTLWVRCWMGPRSRLDVLEKRKKILTHAGIPIPDCQVRSLVATRMF